MSARKNEERAQQQLRLEWIAAGSLSDNPRNWRRHPKHQLDALRDVVRDPEVGWAGAALFNERTGRLIDGHARKKISKPDELVPVLVGSWSDAAERKILATLDPIGGLATADPEALKSLIADTDLNAPSLREMCDQLLKQSELAAAAAAGKKEAIEDVAPPPPATPLARPGDLWILGRHRVLCGDATKIDVLPRLMAGKLAKLVWTDPPYNVAYTGGTKDALTIQNDSMESAAFRQFLRDAFAGMFAVTVAGGPIYVCHADSEGLNFRLAFADAGWLLKQTLVWAKNAMVLGRQDYQWRHEPILYGWKPGGKHRWYGGRKQTTVIDDVAGITAAAATDDKGGTMLTLSTGTQTIVVRVPSYELETVSCDSLESVWRFDKPVRNAEHPTMKPVGLPTRAMRNSSMPGDIVYDGFLGSGSTLSAAEQFDRTCYGTELDPRYVDVIVNRWEALSGKKADRQREP